MIQPVDLVALELDTEDENRYKPLHSLVESYNKRNVINQAQITDALNQIEPIVWETSNIAKQDEPFVAGFKEDLDKVFKDHSMRSVK